MIACPTDSVYGLRADVFNRAAMQRIYEVKKRVHHQQLPLLVAAVEQVASLPEDMPPLAWFLARRCWLEWLTLVLPEALSLPSYLTPGSTTAVHIPDHPICLAVVKRLRTPVRTGTNANVTGQPPAASVEQARRQLATRVKLIVNESKCSWGKKCAVVDVSGDIPKILPDNIIPAQELDSVHKENLEMSRETHCYRL